MTVAYLCLLLDAIVAGETPEGRALTARDIGGRIAPLVPAELDVPNLLRGIAAEPDLYRRIESARRVRLTLAPVLCPTRLSEEHAA